MASLVMRCPCSARTFLTFLGKAGCPWPECDPCRDTWKGTAASLRLTLPFPPDGSWARAPGDSRAHSHSAVQPWPLWSQPCVQAVTWASSPACDGKRSGWRCLFWGKGNVRRGLPGGLWELLRCCLRAAQTMRLRTGRTSSLQHGEGNFQLAWLPGLLGGPDSGTDCWVLKHIPEAHGQLC